jgi:hypothetical protein
MTNILVATRSGLASAPDGSKYRLARGRTLADARHPLAVAYPEMFAPYAIELSVDDDASLTAAGDASRVDEALQARQIEAEAVADGYRMTLATIADGLEVRGLVPAELDTTREGWLVELLFGIIDAPAQAAEDEPADAPAPAQPAELPKPRKRAPRPRAGDTQE